MRDTDTRNVLHSLECHFLLSNTHTCTYIVHIHTYAHHYLARNPTIRPCNRTYLPHAYHTYIHTYINSITHPLSRPLTHLGYCGVWLLLSSRLCMARSSVHPTARHHPVLVTARHHPVLVTARHHPVLVTAVQPTARHPVLVAAEDPTAVKNITRLIVQGPSVQCTPRGRSCDHAFTHRLLMPGVGSDW